MFDELLRLLIFNYSQERCMAFEPPEGMRSWCPNDAALEALMLALVAFGIVSLVVLIHDAVVHEREQARGSKRNDDDDIPPMFFPPF